MFLNLINAGDLLDFYSSIKRKHLSLFKIFSRIFSSNKKRIQTAWSHIESPPTHWWDIPQINERWNLLISGDYKTNYYDYFIKTYLSNKTKIVALSLGCGTGHRELRWASSGKFERIDAIDLSSQRINYAHQKSIDAGFSNIINFEVQDFLSLPETNTYDLILCEQSLHHFYPMKNVVEKLFRLVKNEGLLLVNEYVGPNRFQWTNEQLYYTNKLLQEIPVKYRRFYKSGLIKKKVYKPGLLRMILSDYSEAVESENILPFLQKTFSELELKAYGGTILHPLFNGIAHNFLTPDKEIDAVIKKCFRFEDNLMHSQIIKSDFIFAVYKKESQ